jgi:2,4-didehydro-3-deoxy-L-rhamnonate hydrolase
MKLCRYIETETNPLNSKLGLIENDQVFDVSQALQVIPPERYPYARQDLLIAYLPQLCAAANELRAGAARLPISKIKLLSPIANPPKIIGAPINYQAHVDESKADAGIAHGRVIPAIRDWGLFLKSSTSLIGFGEQIVLRYPERRNDHECELAVVIGKACSKVSKQSALSYVAGYSIGLDMTLRGPEFQCWRKSIDTYSVLGPWLVTADEISDPGQLDLHLRVNGELRQESNTRHLVLGVAELIEWASSMYALFPGDIIMTGTPAGVGPVVPGDVLSAYVQGIGEASIKIASQYD